jgi:TetR/AcrR family transcriptional regulator, acrAB operon repressor
MKRTPEEAAQTRQQLLDAALAVFSRKGYHATRLEDIAEAANVTRGAIYHHFGNKTDLYHTLIQEVSDAFGQIINQAIEQGGDFETIGARVMVNTWVFLDENLRARQITELFYYKTGDSPELAQMRDQRNAEATAFIEAIAGFMQGAILEGELPATLDPYNGARSFISYQNGVALQWLTNPNAYSLKENAKALAKIYMRGLMGQ